MKGIKQPSVTEENGSKFKISLHVYALELGRMEVVGCQAF